MELSASSSDLANGDKEYVFKIFNNPNNGGVDSPDFSLRVYPQNLTNIVAPAAAQITPVVIYKVQGIGLNQQTELKMTGTPAANGAHVIAELCDYQGDLDSQQCNIVNLTPVQDDETKA